MNNLPEKEGYIIEWDEESGMPFYMSVEAHERMERVRKSFYANIERLMEKDYPRKGKIDIISTPADLNGSDKDFHKLWSKLNPKP